MANVGPTTWYVRDNAPTSTIGWSAVTAWAATTAKTAGQLVRQLATPSVGSERVFACIIAGTTLGAEPAWTVTKGAKTAEAAGPTWQEVTGQPGVNGDTTNSPTWLQNKNTAVTLGLIIYDSVSAALQIVSTAGTTGNGAAPSFSATAGTTTADNTVTWTSLGLASGFGAYAAPQARVANAIATNWAAATNNVFVGDDHAETQASAITLNGPGSASQPIYVWDVDHTVVPPGSANLKTAASITTTGNNGINISQGNNTNIYLNGFIFNAGTGNNNVTFALGAGNFTNNCVLENCAINMIATGTGAIIALGSGATWGMQATLINTTVQFSNASQGLDAHTNNLVWKNTPSAIVSGTLPTTLFKWTGGPPGVILIDGVDFSALGSGKTIIGATFNGYRVMMQNCKFGASVTVAAQPSSRGNTVDVVTSDSAATVYQQQRYWYEGTLTPSTTLVRTGGASDGTTAISWQIATAANVVFLEPFESFPISIWNTVTGTNRVVTLYGLWNSASLPNNDQVWLEVAYMGSSGTPVDSFATQTKANGLAGGSALSADSASQWGSAATARQNSHAYVVGNVIAVSDATAGGTIFFCTGNGTSAGSEPGGYATAVDGGVVTDGTATFRAATRFILTVTLSAPQPQLAGYLRATIKAALASTTWFVDPLINLS